MTSQRPLDVLNKALETTIIIRLKGGRELRGRLKGYDMHMNLVLENTDELEGGNASKSYGTIIIRGDNVIFISP